MEAKVVVGADSRRGVRLVDLVLKGRGIAITDHLRHSVEHKLSKFDRRPHPPVVRVEVELIEERNPRIEGRHRVKVAFDTLRRTFRAEGSGPDVDSALDQVSERIERQISDYRSKREDARTGRRLRLQSGASPGESASPV